MSVLLPVLQDSTYNIPVAVWVPEQYPEEAPIVYVVPVPGMIIKPRHACVDGSGFVRSRYLEEWGPTSSLYRMVQVKEQGFLPVVGPQGWR